MKKYKVALALMVIVLLTALGAKQYSTITMGDDEWIGLGASAGRIVFDNQATDEVTIIDANFGVGTLDPLAAMHVEEGQLMIRRASAGGGNSLLQLRNLNKAAGNQVDINFSTLDTGDDVDNAARISAIYTARSATGVTGELVFSTANDANNPTEAMRLDYSGNLEVVGYVAEERIEAGDGARDVDARADMPFAAAVDDSGGSFFYTADVTSDTDLTGVYSTEANVRRQAWVRWLVFDVSAATTHYGEAVLENLDIVVIADEGANDLQLKVLRGAPPNLESYLCLDVVGNHTYEVTLLAMWQ